jgi:hypothetical protein
MFKIMNEHLNKIKNEYRYKSKELKISQYFPSKMGDSFIGYTKNGVKSTFIKHNFRPYFIYNLFWYFKKLKNQSLKLTISNKIAIISIVVIVILYLLDRLYFKLI